MSKHLTFSSAALQRLSSIGGLTCLCLLLSGCPSASNPTQPQTPPTPSSTPPPTSSSSSSPGSSSTSSPSQPSASSPASGSESSSQSPPGQTSDATGPPEEQTGGASGEQSASAEDSAGAQQAGSNTESGTGEGEAEPDLSDAEPSFSEGAAGSESLPDMRDEPGQQGKSGATANTAGEAGGGSAGTSGSSGVGQPGGQVSGSAQGGGSGGYGMPSGGGGGPLTPAEQVAILDAQLEKGAGEFDAMILKTEAEQRSAARAQAARRPPTPIGGQTGSAGSSDSDEGTSPYEEGMADAGGYSTGGGMGGASAGGGVPQNTAKYPAPADIPSGNDDDVVARQLREAASREPDPAVREKLWDEYRKYKGVK